VVPLLRAEGGEKESQVGLVAPENGRPTEAETMILLLTPMRPSLSRRPCQALTVSFF